MEAVGKQWQTFKVHIPAGSVKIFSLSQKTRFETLGCDNFLDENWPQEIRNTPRRRTQFKVKFPSLYLQSSNSLEGLWNFMIESVQNNYFDYICLATPEFSAVMNDDVDEVDKYTSTSFSVETTVYKRCHTLEERAQQ